MVCSSGSLTALSLMMIFFRFTGAVSVLNALVISATSCIGFRASLTGHPLRYSMHRTQCSMHWSSPLVLNAPASALNALVIICGAQCTGLSAHCTGHHLWCSMHWSQCSMHWSSSAVPPTDLSTQCTGHHLLHHVFVSALNALTTICYVCIGLIAQCTGHHLLASWNPLTSLPMKLGWKSATGLRKRSLPIVMMLPSGSSVVFSLPQRSSGHF